jgi:hypothetical protein
VEQEAFYSTIMRSNVIGIIHTTDEVMESDEDVVAEGKWHDTIPMFRVSRNRSIVVTTTYSNNNGALTIEPFGLVTGG